MNEKYRMAGMVRTLGFLIWIWPGGIITAQTPTVPKPKNIIIMISDGCGFNHIDMAGYYRHGEKGRWIYEQFPVKLAVTTGSTRSGAYDPDDLKKDFSLLFEKPTDSAAAATAIATGIKTFNEAISVDPEEKPVKTVFEQAEVLGKSTGVVTNSYFNDATPAAFAAHDVSRGNYGSLARQMIFESGLEVIFGVGHPLFDNNGRPTRDPKQYKYFGGTALWERLVRDPTGADADGDGKADRWTVLHETKELEALVSGTTPPRVLGIAHAFNAMQALRAGGDVDPHTALPYQTPRMEYQPALSEMARAALNILDENEQGFLLMIESEGVDETSHPNWAGRMIEEVIDFAETVTTVVEWIEQHGGWDENLLVVTSDHETGGLVGPGTTMEYSSPINRGKGKMPAYRWLSKDHSTLPIPLYARGVGAERLLPYADRSDPHFGKYLDIPELGRFLFSVLE